MKFRTTKEMDGCPKGTIIEVPKKYIDGYLKRNNFVELIKERTEEPEKQKTEKAKSLPTFDEMLKKLPEKETDNPECPDFYPKETKERRVEQIPKLPTNQTLTEIMQEHNCDRNTAFKLMKEKPQQKENLPEREPEEPDDFEKTPIKEDKKIRENRDDGYTKKEPEQPEEPDDFEKTPITIPKQLLPYHFCLVNKKIPMGEGWQKKENTYTATDPKLLSRLKKGDNYGVVGGINDIMIVDCDNADVFNAFSDHHDTLTSKTGNGTHLYYRVPGLQESIALQELNRKDSTPDKPDIQNCGHITSAGRMVVAPGCLHYDLTEEKKYVPSGKRYKLINDMPIKTISRQELDKIIKPFDSSIIRAKWKIEQDETNATNVTETEHKRDIDISLVAEKMDELEKKPPGYRGHNPDHPKSKSRMDLAINTTDNTWICAPCSQAEGGHGDALYLIALNEGILHCHECKKGGLRGDNFVKVKKLAIEKYGIPEEMLPKKKQTDKTILMEKYKVYKTKTDEETGKTYIVGIKIPNLAELILNEADCHFVTLEEKNKPIWYYNGKHYKPNGELKIGSLVLYYCAKYFNKHIWNEVVAYIQCYNIKTRLDFNPPPNLINMKNGVYNLKTDDLVPHSYKHLFLSVLNVNYDKNAKCPNYEKFLTQITTLDTVTRPDVFDTLQEYLGYCLYREYILKKYLIVDGNQDNGKTTLMNIWIAFLGEMNIASIPLQELNDTPFRKHKLYGKLGNFADDLPHKALKYGGIIKQITGNSPIWADIKNNADGIWFRNYAKPFFTCNELPETADTGNAFFDRQIQATITNKYVRAKDERIDNKTIFERDLTIYEKCTTPEELSGMFNHALSGLKRLIKNKRFSDTATTEENRENWVRKSDPISTYIMENLEETHIDCVIISKELEKSIKEYCRDHNISKDITANKITRKLSQMDIIKKHKIINGENKWCFLGIQHITDITLNHIVGENYSKKDWDPHDEEQQKIDVNGRLDK